LDPFRSSYRQLTDDERLDVEHIKRLANSLHYELIARTPRHRERERALALTKLEECVMWAVKGITA
jgi:hypothetical protein